MIIVTEPARGTSVAFRTLQAFLNWIAEHEPDTFEELRGAAIKEGQDLAYPDPQWIADQYAEITGDDCQHFEVTSERG